MRIERLEVVPYALPFRAPYVTVRGRLDRRELVLVRLHAGGVAGLGESAALALRGGEPLARIVAELERAAPLVEGAELDPERWAEVAEAARPALSREALCALETALLDLAGRVRGEPAWRLLGAGSSRPLECNATLTAGTPAGVAAQAESWAARGFGTFKLKVGMDGDVEQVAAARGALGPQARLRVDANGAWGVDRAAERLASMRPLELAEQPVATLEQLVALAMLSEVPLAADESVVTAADARAAASACACATVKLAKAGGPSAALAVARELPVYLSSALEGPVGIAAAAHVAQAIPDAGLAHGLATGLLFAETVGSGPSLDGAILSVGDAPGLGVELDEDALARSRL